MIFQCPKCNNPIGFDYADYSFKEFAEGDKDHFEELECKCGKKLKTVPWIAVFDEEEESAVTYV